MEIRENEKRCGCGGSGGAGRSKRKSGWLDEEAREGSSSIRNRRRKFSKKDLPPLPNPPPDMPREFKEKINGLGGKDVTLILQKVFPTSDMSRHWCRLSLPKSQFPGMGFLREGERRKPDDIEEIPVRVIFPILSEKNLIFTVLGKRKKGESNTKKAEPTLTQSEDGEDKMGNRAKKAKTGQDNDEDSKTETPKVKSTDEQGKDATKESKPWSYVLRTGWRAAAEESGLDVPERIQL